MGESFSGQPQRPKDSTEEGHFSLKEPELRDGKYVYEIEPQCPVEHIRGLADAVRERFGGMDRFGFGVKVAITADGDPAQFADLVFAKNVDPRVREEVAAFVRSNLNAQGMNEIAE